MAAGGDWDSAAREEQKQNPSGETEEKQAPKDPQEERSRRRRDGAGRTFGGNGRVEDADAGKFAWRSATSSGGTCGFRREFVFSEIVGHPKMLLRCS
jgi:hypothetical protein